MNTEGIVADALASPLLCHFQKNRPLVVHDAKSAPCLPTAIGKGPGYAEPRQYHQPIRTHRRQGVALAQNSRTVGAYDISSRGAIPFGNRRFVKLTGRRAVTRRDLPPRFCHKTGTFFVIYKFRSLRSKKPAPFRGRPDVDCQLGSGQVRQMPQASFRNLSRRLRVTRTGQFAPSSTRVTTLPMMTFSRTDRPREPMTIRSQSSSSWVFRMT